METGSSIELIIASVLLFFSIFFSMAETSLTSLSDIKIRNMAEEGKKGAKNIENLKKDKQRLINSILIGANFSNIALSAIVTAFVLQAAGNNPTSIAIATALATFVVLVFGEAAPKTIAIKYAERIALFISTPLKLLLPLLSPISILLNFIIKFIFLPFGFNKYKKEITLTEAEIKTMLEVSYEEGIIESDEKQMLKNIIEFEDTPAKFVMTQRTDVVAIELRYSYSQVLQVFKQDQFSRLPVYKDNIDSIVGVLHIKDFVAANPENFSVSKYMRIPFFAFELKRTSSIFTEMRTTSSSLAIILDEYGGTAGIISIEDIMEEIVGEIFDEHDNLHVRKEIEKLTDNEYLLHGSVKITDFNELSGLLLKSDEYESIGGYVMGLFGKVPAPGAIIEDDDAKFIIEKIGKNRIERLRVSVEYK